MDVKGRHPQSCVAGGDAVALAGRFVRGLSYALRQRRLAFWMAMAPSWDGYHQCFGCQPLG